MTTSKTPVKGPAVPSKTTTVTAPKPGQSRPPGSNPTR